MLEQLGRQNFEQEKTLLEEEINNARDDAARDDAARDDAARDDAARDDAARDDKNWDEILEDID